MTKNYKAVLKSSLIMLSLLALAVVSSGVAQAQQCFARRASGSVNAVRAEGMTELLRGIELLCNGGGGAGFGAPDMIDISIELNTAITNDTDTDDEIQGLTYMFPNPQAERLGAEADYKGKDREVLSDDGTAIMWKVDSTALGISMRDDMAKTVTIGGIMADASAVGNGEDITATVTVSGVEASGSPVKLADVTTGLDIAVTAASGLQCEAGEAKATIMFTEGFNSAIRAVADDDGTTDVDESDESSVLVLNFRGIPDGVTVMASLMGTGEAMKDDMTDLAPLMLVTGETEGADDEGVVSLSSAGAGEVMYTFDTGVYDPTPAEAGDDEMTPQVDDGTKEWNNVEITFTWEAGEPPLDMGTVTVSYDPVSSDTDDIPRYVAGPTNDVIGIEDCTTELLFPYVTNQKGYNTGLVLTNASDGKGYCTIGYSGPDAPDDMMTPEPVEGGAQWVDLLSNIAAGFQGYITASCEFRNAHGFAFITDADADLAQGYLAVCTNCK